MSPSTTTETTLAAVHELSAVARADLMQVGVVASATGRSRDDVNRSLMIGDIVGVPVKIVRNAPANFRADLHRATALSTTSADFRLQRIGEMMQGLKGGCR